MEKMEEIERDDTDDDNNFDAAGVVIDDDIFDGLDELIGPATGDSFSTSKTGAPFRGCQITWPPQPPPLPAGVDFWKLELLLSDAIVMRLYAFFVADF